MHYTAYFGDNILYDACCAFKTPQFIDILLLYNDNSMGAFHKAQDTEWKSTPPYNSVMCIYAAVIISADVETFFFPGRYSR